jgi:hypothetical protein
MNQSDSRYPRNVELGHSQIEMRLMTPADEQSVLEFAGTLPAHDLLFLRRDITQPKVLSAWIRVGSAASSGEVRPARVIHSANLDIEIPRNG